MSNPIPEKWKETSIACNAVLITDGSHFSPQTVDGGMPIATVQNMRTSQIDVSSCRRISREKFDELAKGNCEAKFEDVLFSKDGTVGKVLVYRQQDRLVLLSSIAIIRLNQDKMSPDFCSQFLQSPLFYKQLENAKTGSAIKRVVLKDIKTLKLPTPPLLEQRKIAEILTSVDTVIERTQAQIDKLKAVKTGMMQELLSPTPDNYRTGDGSTSFKDSPLGPIPEGWEVEPLSEVVERIVDCEHKTAPYVDSSEFMVVRTSNVRDGNLLYEDMKRTTEEAFGEWTKRAIPQYGDVLFTREAPAGESCMVPKGAKLCMGQRMVLLRPNETAVLPNFFSLFLNGEVARKEIFELSIGTTVSRINIEDIKRINIVVPPMPEQELIVSALNPVQEAIAAKESMLHKLGLNKKALMQDLLTGKVRVTVDSDS